MSFEPFTPSGGNKSAKIDGVVVGIVTNNKDPDNLGRVKLKLPIREGDRETDWVRIATLMSGKDMGVRFIPEVNDEVLVAFHLGEPRQPFVIGSLWNTKNPSPKGNDKNDIRKIKTRSGHELIFDDKSGDESITIKTKKGQKIELKDKDSSIKITENSGSNSVTIKGGSANEITIKSGTSVIKLNNKGDVSIESTKMIKIKSTQINIEASATATIKAGAALNLKSDGILTLKGSIVKIN